MGSHERAPQDRGRAPRAPAAQPVATPSATPAESNPLVQVQLSSPAVRPSNALALQRVVGNRAVGKLLQAQRGGPSAGGAPAGPAASSPTGLPGGLRGGLERLSGQDLSGVRVHANSPAPARIGALATTQGQDIHLGPGQEKHLPHEGWHAVQQLQGRVQQTTQAKGAPVNDSAILEHEADVMGARALQHAPAPDLGAAPESARGGATGDAVLQAKFAVQVELYSEPAAEDEKSGASSSMPSKSEPERVNKVHVAGRPPGLFDPAEKSHTTAWAVYTDQLRNGILGRTVPDAIMAIRALYVDAQKLPGVARVNQLPDGPRRVYDEAKKTMDQLYGINPAALAPVRVTDLLQRLGAGFLAYRNAVPLSQVDLGHAPGHGEPEILKTLRPVNDLRKGWEPNPMDDGGLQLQSGAPEKIRAAMWSLLDAGAVTSLDVLEPDNAKAPGTGGLTDTPTQRIADVIVQHLWTLESTYTTAFRASEMDGDASIQAYLTSLGYKGSYAAAITAKIQHHYATGSDNTFEESEARLNTAGPADQGNFSVQVRTKPDETVSELSVGGRAPTLLGTSQGSHTTAWIVYVEGVRNQVMGQPIIGAIKNVIALIKRTEALPGMARVGNLDEHQAYWHKLALLDVANAISNAQSAKSADEYIPALQRLVKAYLFFRNAVPLSQVKAGLADGNAEGMYRARLRFFESGFKTWTGRGMAPSTSSADPYWQAFWELYDFQAMMKAADHDLEPADAPGLHPFDDSDVFMADSIKQHLLAMELAYPVVYARLKPASEEGIHRLFRMMKEIPPQKEKAITLRVLKM